MASAGATLLGPFCFLAMTRAGFRNFGTVLTALVLGVGCVAYAGTCSLDFVAGSRDRAISEHTAAADKLSDAKTRFDLAAAELVTLKGQSERIVERRRKLMATLAEVSKEKRDIKPAPRPDSQASALAFYLRAAGWKVADDDVGTWLNLGTVILTNLKGRPWTGHGFRSSWRKACAKAGVRGLTFHDLRGTAVTRLSAADCTPQQIAAITGHSLRDVTNILDKYSARTGEIAIAAIAKLERGRK